MTAIKSQIIDKLDQLPEPILEQVYQFVNNLTAETDIDDDPFLKVIGVLSTESINSEEIDDIVYNSKE
jgi:hypothetical protein